MAALEKTAVMSSLIKKGYREEDGAQDHHYFIYYDGDRKTLVRTKTSRSPKVRTLDDSLVSTMAKQCHLSKSDFVDLVRCPLSAEKYRLMLLDRHLLG